MIHKKVYPSWLYMKTAFLNHTNNISRGPWNLLLRRCWSLFSQWGFQPQPIFYLNVEILQAAFLNSTSLTFYLYCIEWLSFQDSKQGTVMMVVNVSMSVSKIVKLFPLLQTLIPNITKMFLTHVPDDILLNLKQKSSV